MKRIFISVPLIIAGCSMAPTAPVNKSHASQTKPLITNYTTPGNLISTYKVGCSAITDAQNNWTPADIYPGVYSCIQKNDYVDALGLFLLAGSYGYFDALRVSDPTARDAPAVLIDQMSSGLTPEQKSEFAKAAAQILEDPSPLCVQLQKLGPPDYFPTYMIQHGMQAFSGPQPNGGLVKGFDKASGWMETLRDYVHCK